MHSFLAMTQTSFYYGNQKRKKRQETVELFHSFVVAFLLFFSPCTFEEIQLLLDDGEETSSSIHRKWLRARGPSFFLFLSIDRWRKTCSQVAVVVVKIQSRSPSRKDAATTKDGGSGRKYIYNTDLPDIFMKMRHAVGVGRGRHVE